MRFWGVLTIAAGASAQLVLDTAKQLDVGDSKAIKDAARQLMGRFNTTFPEGGSWMFPAALGAVVDYAAATGGGELSDVAESFLVVGPGEYEKEYGMEIGKWSEKLACTLPLWVGER